MAAQQPCGKCDKLVYATEKQEAGPKWYHKGCFKCSDTECNIQLTLKTFKVVDGSLYCEKHLPKPKATQVSDSVSVMHALNAPKKTAEGLHKTTVGTGEVPQVGLDSVSTQHALNAPKKTAEGLMKTTVGTGEVPQIGLDSVSAQHALNAPKKAIENIGNVQKGGVNGPQSNVRGSVENVAAI